MQPTIPLLHHLLHELILLLLHMLHKLRPLKTFTTTWRFRVRILGSRSTTTSASVSHDPECHTNRINLIRLNTMNITSRAMMETHI
jgi:hypothetical protein